MLRLSLVGPGNVDFHFYELLGMPWQKYEKHITEIAKVLADKKIELVLAPDKGVSFDIAKKFKIAGGKKVVGAVPYDDKDFGIRHLHDYITSEIHGKKVFDEFINTKDWYRQNLTLTIYGDAVLYLGTSLGSIGELAFGFYLYKLFLGKKKGVKTQKLSKEIRAGKKFPLSVIVYKPFVKGKLSKEIESYIKSLKGRIYYVKNPDELKKVLRKFN